jgi:hypothetical protein
MLAAIFIGMTATLFLVFPRVVNWLADQLGNMGDPIELVPALTHWAIALLINFVLLYLYVFRPLQHFRRARRAQGLVLRKGEGVAFMDAESVRQQVFKAVSHVDSVQRTEVSVSNDLGRAVVQVNVLVDNQINGVKKKQEIRREIKKVVEDQLGVGLASEPVINIRLAPIGQEVPYATSPEAPYSPPPAPSRTAAPAPIPAPSPEAAREPGDGVRSWRREPPDARRATDEQPVPEAIKGLSDFHVAAPPSSQPVIARRPLEFGAGRAAESVVEPSPESAPEPDDEPAAPEQALPATDAGEAQAAPAAESDADLASEADADVDSAAESDSASDA